MRSHSCVLNQRLARLQLIRAAGANRSLEPLESSFNHVQNVVSPSFTDWPSTPQATNSHGLRGAIAASGAEKLKLLPSCSARGGITPNSAAVAAY
jgi:hypothetical protein